MTQTRHIMSEQHLFTEQSECDEPCPKKQCIEPQDYVVVVSLDESLNASRYSKAFIKLDTKERLLCEIPKGRCVFSSKSCVAQFMNPTLKSPDRESRPDSTDGNVLELIKPLNWISVAHENDVRKPAVTLYLCDISQLETSMPHGPIIEVDVFPRQQARYSQWAAIAPQYYKALREEDGRPEAYPSIECLTRYLKDWLGLRHLVWRHFPPMDVTIKPQFETVCTFTVIDAS